MPSLLLYIDKQEHWPDRYKKVIESYFPDISVQLAQSVEMAHESLEEADILFAYGESLNADFFSKPHRLKWIHNFASGMDWTENLPNAPDQPLLTSTRGVHGAPVSEMAMMMMLSLARNFVQFISNKNERVWQRLPSGLLENKNVGILGVGIIAESLAFKCQAMGMNVIGFSGSRKSVKNFDCIYPRDQLLEKLSEIDFLVLLLPLSQKTRHIINSDVLHSMKSSSFLINVARGGIVDENALVAALEKKVIAGAALDVFSTEPLPSGHKFWSMKNVIITPHNAGYYDNYVENAAADIFTINMKHFLAGEFDQLVNRYDLQTQSYL